MHVINSTLSGNSASLGGGIYNARITSVTNSTLTGNSAPSGGGGIFAYAAVNVRNCTISSNFASGPSGSGGGIFNNNSASPTIVKSSIIALNTATSNPDLNGSFTSQGLNLIGKNDGAATSFPAGNPNANQDIVGTIAAPVDPNLDPNGLQNNGGPTRTVALLSGSPAIDKGISNSLTVDQRGVGYLRTIDDSSIPNATGGDNTDIGAFEFGAKFSAVSSKTHGPNPDPLQTFGIDLPLTGTPLGVECRRNTGADTTGPNVGRDHEIILTFPSSVTVGAASVTSNDMADTPMATFSVSSNVVTVYLHNIASAPRRLTINLLNASDGTNTNNVGVPMGLLLGDVNGSGVVTSGDTNLCKAQALQPLTGGPTGNFRNDINASGSITTGDVNLIKQNALTGLP